MPDRATRCLGDREKREITLGGREESIHHSQQDGSLIKHQSSQRAENLIRNDGRVCLTVRGGTNWVKNVVSNKRPPKGSILAWE